MPNFSYAYASSHDNCEYYSEKYFQINSCGALKKEKAGLSLRSPRKDYLLIYLYEGTGWLEINGERLPVYAGDIVFLKPGAPLNFCFYRSSMHFWIHFTGTAVDDIFSECGITETGKYSVAVSNDLWEILTDIYIHKSVSSNAAQLQAKGLFFNFLGMLSEFLAPEQSEVNVIREKKIYPALKDMNINFDKNHKLEYYANLCGISLSSFQHMFTKITGVTPQKYLITLRIENAKKMLISENISIKEVSLAVGYEDQLYFSRIFKKAVGKSPSQYAKGE